MSEPMPSRRQVIADDIRNQITNGHFKAGARLPSEARLASRYGVSTATLRNALALLQGEGLVEKIHGKGNFVCHPLRRVTYLGGGRTPVEPNTVGASLSVNIRTINLPAEGDLVSLLGVPANTPLTQFLCVRHEGKSPHSLARIYVPRALTPPDAPCEPPSRRVRGFETDLAEHRPPLAEIRERVTARLPTAEEAATLRISPVLAVLAITRLAVDTAERVVEAALLVLPGDRADAYFITQPAISEKRRKG